MIAFQLLNNLTILLALGILYSFLTSKISVKSIPGQSIAGFLFGGICIIGMTFPVVLEPGVVFDGRSVILSASGIFGGPFTAIIAALMAVVYRIAMGGSGMIMGVSVILSSAALSIIYSYVSAGKTKYFKIGHFFVFGLIVHIVMLILTLTLPSGILETIVPRIVLPVLVFYPLTTVGLFYILNDLEKKNMSVKDLKKNEQLLRLFVLHTPSSVAMFDRNMKYIIASKRYMEDFKLGTDDITGQSHYELFPEIPDHWKEIHKRCLNGAIEKADEDIFKRMDGSVEYLKWEVHPWYENEKNIGGIIIFSEVITAQKISKDLLVESEKYNRTLFNESIIGLALAKLDGSLIHVNPAYAKIIGRTIEETLKLSYWDITPEKYAEQEKEQLKLLNTVGTYGPYEKEYIHKEGHLVPVRLQGLLIEKEGEKLIWSSIEDISDRKEKEEKIEQQMTELRRWYEITLGREDKIIQLKEEVNDLMGELGREKKYKFKD